MEIKFDKRNYRKHDKKNKSLIKKSLEKFGAGRSIVIDAEGEIIGGNGVYEQAQKLGLKTKIVETDGSELVVVKRTDLKTDDDKRKALAVMDNSTSDTSEFDLELLTADFTVDELEDFGIELPEEEEEQKKEVEEMEVPDVLEKEDSDKPFTVKLTFEKYAALNAFREQYEELIKSEYDVTISISGGKL